MLETSQTIPELVLWAKEREFFVEFANGTSRLFTRHRHL